MKIGILSMQKVKNFGSVLQAYSLRHIIYEITHENAVFLDIEHNHCIEVNMPVKDDADSNDHPKLKKDPYNRVKWKLFRLLEKLTGNIICSFMKSELKAFPENNSNQYDIVVVGSDEVFKSVNTLNLQLYGDIPQASRCITYAASCGCAVIEGIPLHKREIVSSALSNFQAMSVRDVGTENYVLSLYNGRIERHLDPVLIGPLSKMKHRKVPFRNYLLVYAYGSRIRSESEICAIKAFAKKHGLKTVAIGGAQFWCDYFIPATPFRMLDYFYYADYIVTDTFHGTIFSVINHKKVAIIVRKTNKNKLTDLAETLQIKQRIIEDFSQFESIISSEIDYVAIDRFLEKERISTYEYLRRELYV